jgi:hypothetical protein
MAESSIERNIKSMFSHVADGYNVSVNVVPSDDRVILYINKTGSANNVSSYRIDFRPTKIAYQKRNETGTDWVDLYTV